MKTSYKFYKTTLTLCEFHLSFRGCKSLPTPVFLFIAMFCWCLTVVEWLTGWTKPRFFPKHTHIHKERGPPNEPLFEKISQNLMKNPGFLWFHLHVIHVTKHILSPRKSSTFSRTSKRTCGDHFQDGQGTAGRWENSQLVSWKSWIHWINKSLNHHMDVSKNRGTPKWMVYN